MMEYCYLCNAPIPVDEKGLPVSKYWRSRFTPDMRIRVRDIVEPYCSAKHSLERYEERGRK